MTLAFALAVLVAAAPTPADEVKSVLTQQAAAWNRGDLEAFCSVYADDAAFLSPTGLTHGRGEVLARYKKRYPDKAAMGTLSFDFLDVRADATHASVMAKWHLAYVGQPAKEGYTLVVLARTGSGWRLLQDASM